MFPFLIEAENQSRKMSEGHKVPDVIISVATGDKNLTAVRKVNKIKLNMRKLNTFFTIKDQVRNC